MSTSVSSDGSLLIRPHLSEEFVEKIRETDVLSVFHIDETDDDGEMSHDQYLQYLDENPRGPNCPEGDYSTVFLTDCDRGLGAGEMPYCLARPEQMLKSLILLLKRFLVPGGYVLDGHYWYHPWDFREIYHFEVKKNKIVSFLVDPFEMERARKAFREELGLSPDEEVDDDDVYSHYLDECEGFYARTCRKFGERQIKAYNEWLKGLRNQKKKRSSAKPPGSYT